MALHLHETTDGHYLCDHGKVGLTMVSYVVYVAGCEECIRKAFAEAQERVLKELNFRTHEHGG